MSALVQPIPPAPSGFDPQRFFEGYHWHQRWQMFRGIYTPGVNPVDAMCDDLQLPCDLTGKRVLDVGAWNGCMSFECERRGATEVVALSPEDPDWSGFNHLHDALGSTRTHYRLGSVYDLDPEELGYFDVVLFCGVLYHLRYPLLGIDNLRRVATGEIYVETHVANVSVRRRQPPPRWRALLRLVRSVWRPQPSPVTWEFFRRGECAGDPSNWFAPTPIAAAHAFESAGFSVQMLRTTGHRATFKGHAKPGAPEFLRIGCGEGVFYDALVRHLFGPGRHGLSSQWDQTLSAVVASPAYYLRSGGTPAAWVARGWGDLLGRAPSAAEHEDAVRRLSENTALRRQGVVLSLMASQEYRTRCAADLFRHYLGRAITAEEKGLALSPWRLHGDADERLLMILSGDEYFRQAGGTNGRWLEQVCRELFGTDRSPGFDGLLTELDKGAARSDVAGAVLKSPEYGRRLLSTIWGTYVGDAAPVPAAWTEALSCVGPAARGLAA
jgi:tRNA (mo5U34)-methyltransferase